MKYFLIALFVFFISNSLGQAIKTDSISEIMEKKIVDSIYAIPEVKEKAQYIENETKGSRHLKVWIYQTPQGKGKNYFWIKVGEDNGSNLVTHFNFIVYYNDFRIKYLDTTTNKIIDLKRWRVQRLPENH